MGERIDIVQISLLACSHEFGTAPCTASGEPCFNSWLTCKDKVNFGDTDQDVFFTSLTPDMPSYSMDLIPFVTDVQHSPATLDPEGSLGKRSSIVVTFIDAPHNDVGFDPYVDQRTYDPMSRALFFQKLKARWPLFGRRLTWYTGDNHSPLDLGLLKKRVFTIEEASGSGRKSGFTIVARDPLKIVDDERVQFPSKSVGYLKSALDATTAYTYLDVYTSNMDEYDIYSLEFTGCVRIGNEIFQYTGVDKSETYVTDGVRLTGVTRSAPTPYDTTKESHSEGSQVQKAPFFYQRKPHEIYAFLLGTIGGLSSYINVSEWENEDDLLGFFRISRLISEPQGIKSHINEIIPQASTFGLWFDDASQKIVYRVNRIESHGIPVALFTDDSAIVEAEVIENSDQLLNELIYSFEQRDPVKGREDSNNYRFGIVTADLESKSSRMYGQTKSESVFARWCFGVNREELVNVANRRILVNSKINTWLQIVLSKKDSEVKLGDLVQVKTRLVADQYGDFDTNTYQVSEVKSVKKGLSITARKFVDLPPISPTYRPIVITTAIVNANLRDLFDANYAGESPLDKDIVLRVIGGGIIGSADTTAYALEILTADFTGEMPSSIKIEVYDGGYIIGKGGYGGGAHFGGYFSSYVSNGGNGGGALRVNLPVTIDNAGIIGGGGGGGGGAFGFSGNTGNGLAGGGAGQGYTASLGAYNNGFTDTPLNPNDLTGSGVVSDARKPGGDSSAFTIGAGGDTGNRNAGNGGGIIRTYGGNGGSLGSNGAAGGWYFTGTDDGFTGGGGLGGTGGPAIDGASYVTWLNEGDVRGAKIG